MRESHQQFWINFAGRLARRRWGLLAFTVLITLVLWGPASRLKLDESIESLYDARDPLLLAYLENKATFGGDEFVLVAYDAPRASSEGELRRLREFALLLSQVPGVQPESTQDLAGTLRNPRASGLFRVALRLPSTERALIDLARHVLIGAEERTLAVVLRLQDEKTSPVPRRETYRRLRALAAVHQPPAYVAGEPIQVYDMFRYVEEDSWMLGWASSVLMMTVILVFFRSLRWVLLPIVIIQATLLWSCGLLELTGLQLSMVSSMLTSLVTVITIATSMHVTVMFAEFRQTLPRREAFEQTFARLAVPIFWISLTTAIGFASLLVSGATPVRSFSIMMSFGSLMIPLLFLFIFPGGILIGRWQADPLAPPGQDFLVRRLQKLSVAAARHPRLVLGGAGLLVVAAVFGLLRLTVETDFSKNFREHSPIVQAIEFYESRLGGVGTWDVTFSVPNRLGEVDLDKVRDLAQQLRELKLPNGTTLTKVIALTDGLDLVPRIPVTDDERGSGLLRPFPRFRLATLDERAAILRQLQPEMESSLYNPAAGRMRIVLRAMEQQPSAVKLELIDAVQRLARQSFPDAQAGGLYVLLAHMISSILGDQLTSFGLSCLGIWLCMTLAFRSIRLGLISLVPNILPQLIVIGGMGWLGIPINIGTAMIASVSIGMTVDSTILYLSDYLRSRAGGADHLAAVRHTQSSAGLALALANIALVAGFSVLALSNFVPLVYFGVLVSAALFGGLLGNLLLLPVLLRHARAPAPAVANVCLEPAGAVDP